MTTENRERTIIESIHDALETEAASIQEVLPRKMAAKCPIVAMTPRDWWPDQIGSQITLHQYARNPDGVNMKMTSRTYGIKFATVQSNPICLNGIDIETEIALSIGMFGANLEGQISEMFWDFFYELAEVQDFTGSALTGEMFGAIYQTLVRNGAGTSLAVKKENGAPVFVAILSRDGLAQLQDQELQSKWLFMQEAFPRRYNEDGSRVLPYNEDGSLDPDYLNAPIEDAVVFHPDVMTVLLVKSKGFEGSAKEHLARLSWNKTGEASGVLKADMAMGARPVRPEFGKIIRHRRVLQG